MRCGDKAIRVTIVAQNKVYNGVINRFLADYGVAEYFDELAGICRESIEKYNEKLIAKNTVSCCFTAYLLGASEINSLPMHYYCKTCKRVEWVEDEKCLFDMRSKRILYNLKL